MRFSRGRRGAAVDNRPPVLLDSSVLIARAKDVRARRRGPASVALERVKGRTLVISVVTVAEVMERAADPAATRRILQGFAVQPITWAVAERCALIQSRAKQRLGENDAWIVAQAEIAGAEILGRDRNAFARLGSRYVRF